MAGPGSRKVGWAEALAGWLILGVLVVIAVGIYFEQFRLHPASRLAGSAENRVPARPAGDRPAALPVEVPEGLVPLSPAEVFDSETLYEKINGKADLYLSAGFQLLECRRFGLPEDPSQGFEVYLFEMESPRAAYAVYSLQWREGSLTVDFGDFAYQAQNLICFCRGRWYGELAALADDPRLTQSMLNLGRRLAAEMPAEPMKLPELEMFPPRNRASDPPRLHRTDGLGFDRLTELFVADYRMGEDDLMGFLSIRRSEAEALELARAYGKFIEADGASAEEAVAAVPGARVWNLFGTYQVVFTRGRVLAGVNQAASREAAAQLAEQMLKHLIAGESP